VVLLKDVLQVLLLVRDAEVFHREAKCEEAFFESYQSVEGNTGESCLDGFFEADHASFPLDLQGFFLDDDWWQIEC